MKYKNFLSIDPGINTGHAFFSDSLHPKTGVIKVKKYEEKERLWKDFSKLLDSYPINFVLIEDAENWQGSFKSSIALKSGALSKLIRLISVYEYICFTKGIPVELVMPKKWKGQLDNNTIRHWIEKMTNVNYKIDHVVCAVGLGLFKLGEF